MIDNLSQATKMYESDFGAYPPGDGMGSSNLVRALQSHGSKKQAYFEFQQGTLDDRGDIMSPIRPGVDIIYYRSVGVHGAFDIWCSDCSLIPDGVNNWGGV